MSEFLILSRPRARSAWLANLFCAPPAALCLHEELPSCSGSVAELRARMIATRKAAGVMAIGCADTGLLHQLPAIDTYFPDARVCLLTGNDDRWRRFANRVGLPAQAREEIDAAYARAVEWAEGNPRCATVHVKALERAPTMAITWEFLTCAGGFNVERFEVLRRFYVVQPAEKIRERAAPEFQGLLRLVDLPDDRPQP